jgi:hypothetical protein
MVGGDGGSDGFGPKFPIFFLRVISSLAFSDLLYSEICTELYFELSLHDHPTKCLSKLIKPFDSLVPTPRRMSPVKQSQCFPKGSNVTFLSILMVKLAESGQFFSIRIAKPLITSEKVADKRHP